MITVIPHDAVIKCAGGFGICQTRSGDWWAIYQWFCDRLIQWPGRGDNYDILNGRSKSGCIGNEFDPLRGMDGPVNRLGYLFACVGTNWIERESGRESRFLDWMKFRKWSDMAKPISIHGRRPKIFPRREWFEMQGRTLIKSPNQYHPRATSVFGFDLKPVERQGGVRWLGRIEYGYPHDSSHWYVNIPQLYGERLDKFAVRIQATIDGLMAPEPWPHGRQCYEMDWARTRRGLDDVFNVFDCRLDYRELTDLFMGVQGSSLETSRIRLDNRRVETIKRWLRADADRIKARDKKPQQK